MQKIFVIFLSLFVSSCGPKKLDDINEIGDTIALTGVDALKEAIESSTVTCMEESCPSYVGKLIFWAKNSDSDSSNNSNKEHYKLGTCSATLIDSNTVVTSSHCVPPSISYNGASCKGQIIVQFPEAQGTREAENIECLSVETVNDYLNGAPDLAVLKVTNSIYKRNAVNVLPNEISSDQKVHTFSVNPSKGLVNHLSGYVYKKGCSISGHNLLTGEVTKNSSDALIYGYDCSIVAGNSGAGVFNSQGVLVGVVHSRIDKSEAYGQFVGNGINVNYLKHMGVMANIGCLESFEDHTISDNCLSASIKTSEDILNYIETIKKASEMANLNDDDIKATIGEDLGLKLSKYLEARTYTRFDNLTKMKENLIKANLNGVNSWATVLK